MTAPFRVAEGSTFQVESFSSAAVAFRSTILLEYDNGKQAPFEVAHTPGTTRASATSNFPGRVNRDAHIITATMQPAALKRGQCFAMIHVLDTSGNRSDVLCAGYITGTLPIRLGQFEDSLSGRGFIRSIDLGDPDAGAEYATQAVPTNAAWRVVSMLGTLVADANAANREFAILYSDATNNYVQNATGGRHTASIAVDYAATLGGGQNKVNDNVAVTGNTDAFPLADTILPEAHEVVFLTSNLQAGDDWTDGQMGVEEWIQV